MSAAWDAWRVDDNTLPSSTASFLPSFSSPYPSSPTSIVSVFFDLHGPGTLSNACGSIAHSSWIRNGELSTLHWPLNQNVVPTGRAG